MSKIEWTAEDSHYALYEEGWDIFSTNYDDEATRIAEKFQIQFWCDFEEMTGKTASLHDDEDAWRMVWRRAKEGSALHQKALDFLKQEGVVEYDRIVNWAAKNNL